MKKKFVVLLIMLAGMLMVQGCAVGSGVSIFALSASGLSYAAEQELIENIRNEHETWHAK